MKAVLRTESVEEAKRNMMERVIAQLLVAALEAMGTLLLYAKVTNSHIEQWNIGWTVLLYFLLLLLYVLLIRSRKE